MKFILLKLIWLYQATISGFLGNSCRFYPSCSNYALESIERYGSLKGGTLAIKRLCKCHPLNPGGVDLVLGDICEGREN